MNIAIVGAGKLGIRIADALIGGDYSITIIDTNSNILQKLSQQLDVVTVNDDARKLSVLKPPPVMMRPISLSLPLPSRSAAGTSSPVSGIRNT